MTQQFLRSILFMNSEYTEYAGDLHRKRYGQFFTHPQVAQFMVDWVRKAKPRQVFDPAFGLGAFRDQIPLEERRCFSAMEIDPKIADFWSQRTGISDDFIAIGNYLDTWGRKYENIVCNPPYMRFQKFLDREVIFSSFRKNLGIALSGYTNIASAFLIKSIEELMEEGRLAYIMPLEFLNTGYGKFVKAKLLEHKHLAAIISLDCEREVFPDATTSVGIILYDKSKQHNAVRFYSFKSLDSLRHFEEEYPTAEVSYSHISPNNKWLPFFFNPLFEVQPETTTPLRTYGKFSRGIATGANEFFSLNRTKISHFKLNEDRECLACITRSAQIADPFFEQENLEALKREDKPVFLFSAGAEPSHHAANYIRIGEQQGFHKRFLTSNRTPWYKTEEREVAPLLLGVFSRGGYKIIRNNTDALNLTCYHGFQPNLFGTIYLDHLFLYLSSKTGRALASLMVRKYGDSLDKFEPNDINDVLVPTPEFFDTISRVQIREALASFRRDRTVPDWLEVKFKQISTPSLTQCVMGQAS